jgi:hypothetical protein
MITIKKKDKQIDQYIKNPKKDLIKCLIQYDKKIAELFSEEEQKKIKKGGFEILGLDGIPIGSKNILLFDGKTTFTVKPHQEKQPEEFKGISPEITLALSEDVTFTLRALTPKEQQEIQQEQEKQETQEKLRQKKEKEEQERPQRIHELFELKKGILTNQIVDNITLKELNIQTVEVEEKEISSSSSPKGGPQRVPKVPKPGSLLFNFLQDVQKFMTNTVGNNQALTTGKAIKKESPGKTIQFTPGTPGKK